LLDEQMILLSLFRNRALYLTVFVQRISHFPVTTEVKAVNARKVEMYT